MTAVEAPGRLTNDDKPRSALSVSDLRVTAVAGDQRRTIVTSFDLELAPGETVGIVGESGSGKTMTARAMIGLAPPGMSATGSVRVGTHELVGMRERDLGRIRGTEISMVLQDPFTMLDPMVRCGKQIAESLAPETPKSARRDEVARRLAEVGIADPRVGDRYPFQLSGGMLQRIGLACALARDPAILIADEPTTGLDVTTQAKILELLNSLQRSRGMALVFITHDLGVAFSTCDRITVMYAGSILESGPAETIAHDPRHPYTRSLLLSEPRIDARTDRLHSVPGSVPSPDAVADRCPFYERCEFALPACLTPVTALPAGYEHLSACIRADEIHDRLAAPHHPTPVTVRSVSSPPPEPTRETSASGALLQVDDLQKTFRHSSRGMTTDVTALAGVSLEVWTGETVGLVGESGSGKTTLGRCVVGLERADSGTVCIDDNDMAVLQRNRRSARRLAPTLAQMVFQDPYSSLNPSLTIGSTLGEVVRVHSGRGSHVKAEVARLLEQVGLSERHARRKPSAMSGGERQRVAIARALAVQPKLLVLDESVSALDVTVKAQIMDLLQRLRRELGLSYLFITHDLAVVRQMADRVYVMHRGSIVESGPVESVIDNPSDAYTQLLRQSVLNVHEQRKG